MKTLVSKYTLVTSVSLLITALIEYLSGRILICKCGYIKFWQADTWSSENSQHITDWYTFSHIIHGYIFYYAVKLLRGLTLFRRFCVALTIEAAWELLENSSVIINRYRTSTISLDYFGDSIINSLSDILAMVFGFYLASKLPWWLTIFLIISMEIVVGYIIRDNLTLNIIVLVHPFTAIRSWQAAGH